VYRKNEKDIESNSNIKTIFFDVGGVLLIDFIDNKIIDLAKKYHKNPDTLLSARKKHRPYADRGQISDSEFWKIMFSEAEINATEEDWEFDSYMEEIEGTRDIIESLKLNAFDIAILSNDSKEMFIKKRKRFGFDELFHDIIISSEHGVIKPYPEIYWIALKRLNTVPERSVLIDDRLENIKAAADIGMYSILFQNTEQLREELYDLGIHLS
jgi:HAD superfamily hydrolase (TIGR01509 family)